jgi:hypothetical protein
LKKTIIIIVFAFINILCSAQKTKVKIEKLNIKEYKTLPLHPNVGDNPNSGNHIYLFNNKVIEYSESNGNISIQESVVNSPYKSRKLYSQKSLILIREEQLFYDFCIGITKIYNDNGILSDSIDCDSKYKFSTNELMKIMKTKYLIDLTTTLKGETQIVSRDYINGKNCYNITIFLNSSLKGSRKNIIIDGNTGEVISEFISTYNPSHNPRI